MKIKSTITLFVITLFFEYCSTPQGFNGASSDIEDSKKRRIFLGEFLSKENPIIINDSTRLTLKQIWIEQTWKHGSSSNSTISQEGFQLCINSTEESLKKYDKDWTIENSFTNSLNPSSKISLVGNIDSLTAFSDTIKYKIVKGSPSLSDSLIVIGKFILVRKK